MDHRQSYRNQNGQDRQSARHQAGAGPLPAQVLQQEEDVLCARRAAAVHGGRRGAAQGPGRASLQTRQARAGPGGPQGGSRGRPADGQAGGRRPLPGAAGRASRRGRDVGPQSPKLEHHGRRVPFKVRRFERASLGFVARSSSSELRASCKLHGMTLPQRRRAQGACGQISIPAISSCGI